MNECIGNDEAGVFTSKASLAHLKRLQFRKTKPGTRTTSFVDTEGVCSNLNYRLSHCRFEFLGYCSKEKGWVRSIFSWLLLQVLASAQFSQFFPLWYSIEDQFDGFILMQVHHLSLALLLLLSYLHLWSPIDPTNCDVISSEYGMPCFWSFLHVLSLSMLHFYCCYRFTYQCLCSTLLVNPASIFVPIYSCPLSRTLYWTSFSALPCFLLICLLGVGTGGCRDLPNIATLRINCSQHLDSEQIGKGTQRNWSICVQLKLHWPIIFYIEVYLQPIVLPMFERFIF